MTKYVSISGIFEEIVAKTTVAVLPTLQAYDNAIYTINFQHGHYLEISRRLEAMSQDPQSKRAMWPTIVLFRDFPETQGIGYYADITCQIGIAIPTEATYTSDEREQKSFIPILYPIYAEFINQCKLDGRVQIQPNFGTKIDHYFWGSQTQYDKSPNIFNEFTDSIEIRDFKPKIYIKNC